MYTRTVEEIPYSTLDVLEDSEIFDILDDAEMALLNALRALTLKNLSAKDICAEAWLNTCKTAAQLCCDKVQQRRMNDKG